MTITLKLRVRGRERERAKREREREREKQTFLLGDPHEVTNSDEFMKFLPLYPSCQLCVVP